MKLANCGVLASFPSNTSLSHDSKKFKRQVYRVTSFRKLYGSYNLQFPLHMWAIIIGLSIPMNMLELNVDEVS